jgi:hypothetical protein
VDAKKLAAAPNPAVDTHVEVVFDVCIKRDIFMLFIFYLPMQPAVTATARSTAKDAESTAANAASAAAAKPSVIRKPPLFSQIADSLGTYHQSRSTSLVIISHRLARVVT